jgi:hypothetical protein
VALDDGEVGDLVRRKEKWPLDFFSWADCGGSEWSLEIDGRG